MTFVERRDDNQGIDLEEFLAGLGVNSRISIHDCPFISAMTVPGLITAGNYKNNR
jgi:hypothetical protein